jgi:hypothetical protein
VSIRERSGEKAGKFGQGKKPVSEIKEKAM